MATRKKSARKPAKKAAKKKSSAGKKNCKVGKECLMAIPTAPKSTNPEAIKKWKKRVQQIRKRNAQVTAIYNEG